MIRVGRNEEPLSRINLLAASVEFEYSRGGAGRKTKVFARDMYSAIGSPQGNSN